MREVGTGPVFLAAREAFAASAFRGTASLSHMVTGGDGAEIANVRRRSEPLGALEFQGPFGSEARSGRDSVRGVLAPTQPKLNQVDAGLGAGVQLF